ncbi:MAG: primosome, DnaD subunit [Thermomicrobiales bacterium]|nr:primosome, DnaD subunit [Thermomicrobiales bacterium]MDF3039374.1 primosome, DnaD subunit [Thermomicrobiales bacterium]
MTRRFSGFLVQTDPAVGIPRAFFTDVLPQLTELSEVQTTLAVFRLAAEAGGIESPVSAIALRADRPLRAALRVAGSPREPDERIVTGLDLATGRGTLLRFVAERGSERDVWYYVNTPVNQALVAAMARGAVAPPRALWREGHPPAVIPERPNVFRLYEQNVGPLTPLIADHLVRALETWPVDWIEDAVAESVAYNKRSWRYIQRILEGWQAQGREPRERYG